MINSRHRMLGYSPRDPLRKYLAALTASLRFVEGALHFDKELFVSQHPDDAGLDVRLHLEATNGGLIVVHQAAGFDAASHSDATRDRLVVIAADVPDAGLDVALHLQAARDRLIVVAAEPAGFQVALHFQPTADCLIMVRTSIAKPAFTFDRIFIALLLIRPIAALLKRAKIRFRIDHARKILVEGLRS